MIGKAIYNILQTIPVRCYPNRAPQTASYPVVVYNITNVNPSDTKDGASTLDITTVAISVFAKDYEEINDIGAQIRAAMDYISHGTYNGVKIQGIRFANQNEHAYDDKAKVYGVEFNYNIRHDRA